MAVDGLLVKEALLNVDEGRNRHRTIGHCPKKMFFMIVIKSVKTSNYLCTKALITGWRSPELPISQTQTGIFSGKTVSEPRLPTNKWNKKILALSKGHTPLLLCICPLILVRMRM